MKKRLLSALLVLCMLTSLVPVVLVPTAATETATQSTTPTSLEDLYVGANGQTTENGGTLKLFLSAYKGNSTYDLTTGKWNSLVGTNNSATIQGTWVEKADGGIGYDLASDTSTTATGYSLVFDSTLLPTDTYALEMVASVRGLTKNADGVTKNDGHTQRAGFTLGRLRGFFWSTAAKNTDNSGQLTQRDNSIIMMHSDTYATNDDWNGMGVATGHWTNGVSVFRNDTSVVNFTVNLQTEGTSYKYSFLKNGISCNPSSTTGTLAATPYQGNFVLFRAVPATVYAIRLYTKPLTEEEIIINRAVDIMMHAGVAFSVYESVAAADKKDFLAVVAQRSFDTTAAQIEEIAENLAAQREQELINRKQNDYDKLYIGADGSSTENGGKLQALLTAYETKSVVFSDIKTAWLDKMNNNDATFEGALWQIYDCGFGYDITAGPNMGANDGGFTTVNTNSPYYTVNDAKNQYLRLPSSLIVGKENFTLEMAFVAKTNVYHTDAQGKITNEMYVPNQIYYVYTAYDVSGNKLVEGIKMASDVFAADKTYQVTYHMNTEAYARNVFEYNTTTNQKGTQVVGYSDNQNNPELGKIAHNTVVTFEKTDEMYLRKSLWVNNSKSMQIGNLKTWTQYEYEYGFASGAKDNSQTIGYNHRYFLTEGNGDWAASTGRKAIAYEAKSIYDNKTHTLAISRVMAADGLSYAYNIVSDFSLSYSLSVEKATLPLEKEGETDLFLLNQAPCTVYAIRVYDAVLTDAEKAWNRFVDLMAYAEADISVFQNASAEVKGFVVNAMRDMEYTKDAEALEESIEEIINMFDFAWDADKSLYVTDGLKILLSSYDGFSTGTRINADSVIWSNAVETGTFGTLVGKNWHRSEDGGLRIRDTVPKSVADSKTVTVYRKGTGQGNFYLDFDYSMLPEEDYTIETVLAPEGITVEDEGGNLFRYYDDYTTYGIYYESAFILGPLRAMGFACYSHASQANMERRWMYQNTGGWDSGHPGGRVEVGTDNSIHDLEVGEIVSYSVTHDFILEEETNPTSKYKIIRDGETSLNIAIDAEKYLSKTDVLDKQFDVWRGLASTMYSVRVYDRILTDEERLQNHVADVCYYFGLDTTLLEEALLQIDDKSTVFQAFSHLSFDMTKEEAQMALDNGMAGVWIIPEGIGIKNNMSDTVRYYFSLQYPALASMQKGGFGVEVGVLLNVDSKGAPTMENNAYDYRFVVFDSVAGTHTEYFLDEDTCAITLSYQNANSALYNKQINFKTYVKLTSESGDAVYFYGGLLNSAYAHNNSLFNIYKYLAEDENVIANGYDAYLDEVVASCYSEEGIYFDSAAVGVGNGTAETPYTDFGVAFEACKEILKNLQEPTHVTLYVAGGTHFINEIAELDFGEVSYPEYTFNIEGDFMADELPTLTSAVNIPYSAFEAVEGKAGLYIYEFAPDGEGNYPKFRNFYVEGFTADLAHSTPTTTANGEFPYISRFDRDHSGTFLRAEYYYNEGTLLDHAPAVEFASAPERTDLIASYTTHYMTFLAMYDLRQKYQDGSYDLTAYRALTAEGLRPGCDAQYKAAFSVYHPQFCNAKAGSIKVNTIKYTYELPTTNAGRPGVLYLHIDMVESLRATVEARIQALKAAGTYNPTSSYKTLLADMQIELNATAEWDFNIIDVAGVDFDDVVYYEIPDGPNGYKGTVETLVAVYLEKEQYEKFVIPTGNNMSNRHVSLQNALEFVDENNEYYYDIQTGKLYYFNENGIEDTTFAYPTLDNMLVFRNARNLTVSDLTIWGVDDYLMSEIGLAAGQAGSNQFGSDIGHNGFTSRAALAFYHAHNVTVQDCYIHDIGGAAIYMEGRVEDTDITGNEIENIGDSAIRVRGDRKANNEFSDKSGAENVRVINNYIHQVAQDTYNAPAIYFASCKDVELAQNTVIGCSYSAYSLGWSWSRATWEEGDKINLYNVDIHHNYITDFMQNLGDGGAFYVLGGNLKPDNPKLVNFIHHNFVVLSQYSGNGLGVHTSCYYFDGSSTNWDFYDNIAVNYSAGADRGANANASYKDYTMYTRRTRRNYIFFMQWTVATAYSYNIQSRNNHAFNVRATDPELQQKEIYSMDGKPHTPYNERGIIVSNTSYYSGVNKLNFSNKVKGMIEETGSYMCPGDWGWLLSNEY